MRHTGKHARSFGGVHGTVAAVREMIDAAAKHVLIAGYALEQLEVLVAPLHAAMLERGVRVEVYVHHEVRGEMVFDLDGPARSQVAAWQAIWPPDATPPSLYLGLRTAAALEHAPMRTTCIVVDGQRVLLGSMTVGAEEREHRGTAGLLVNDARFGEELVRQFHAALAAGLFLKG